MTVSVGVYKGVNKLGTGTATNGSATITSFTTASGNVVGPGRNVQVTITSGSNNVGNTINTRVLVDGVTSLTLNDKIFAS
jgi:hypothetical protein